MINYFEAAEKTLRARGLLETALGNLERKKERILRYGAPSEYPSADMSKPYTGAKSVNDALADCLELAEVMREIQVTRDKVEEIDDVLAQMDEADARILRLWYIERKSTYADGRPPPAPVPPPRPAAAPAPADLCSLPHARYLP